MSGDHGRYTAHKDPATGRFLPGNPGGINGGRPKGLRSKLREQLSKHPDQAQEVIQALIDRALEGDTKAIQLVLDNHDGLLKHQIEDVTDRSLEPRRILIVQTTSDPPPMPREVQVLEDARRDAEDAVQRQIEQGEGAE